MILSEIEQKGLERLRVRIPTTFCYIAGFCFLPFIFVVPTLFSMKEVADVYPVISDTVNSAILLTAGVLVLSKFLKKLLTEPFLLFLASQLYATPYIIYSANQNKYYTILEKWNPWFNIAIAAAIALVAITVTAVVYCWLIKPRNQEIRYLLNCIARNALWNLMCVTLAPVLFFACFIFLFIPPILSIITEGFIYSFTVSLAVTWAVITTDLIFFARPLKRRIPKLWWMMLISILLIMCDSMFFENIHLSKNITYAIFVAILIVVGITVHLIEYRKERRRTTPPKYKG